MKSTRRGSIGKKSTASTRRRATLLDSFEDEDYLDVDDTKDDDHIHSDTDKNDV